MKARTALIRSLSTFDATKHSPNFRAALRCRLLRLATTSFHFGTRSVVRWSVDETSKDAYAQIAGSACTTARPEIAGVASERIARARRHGQGSLARRSTTEQAV